MSHFHFISRGVNCIIGPYCRYFTPSQSNANAWRLVTGRSSPFPKIVGTGSTRNFHVSTLSHNEASGNISSPITSFRFPSASIREINVESLDSVGQSIAPVNVTGSVTSGLTLDGPGSHIGFIFSDSPPVLAVRDMLCQIKDIPGMEWTAVIVLTTVGLRILVGLPITIAQQKSIERLQALQPEIKSLAENLARETSIAVKLYNWNKRKANNVFKKSFKKHWQDLIEKHNCHPGRAVALGLLQIPVWVGLSGAIRNVVYCLPNPATDEMLARWVQIASESTPWVESLATTDPVVFPLIFLTASLVNIQINSLRKLSVPQTKLQIAVPWILRFCVTGIAVFAMFTPSAVTMYWATSSVLALLLNLFLRINRVRLFFGLLPKAKL